MSSSHYGVRHLNAGRKAYTVDDLKKFFPDGKADPLNFVMLSTSGVHGSYRSISDVLDDAEAPDDEKEITILIVHPRIVFLQYGNLRFKRDDEEFLRGLVESSIEAMAESQKENRLLGRTR